MSVKAVLVLAMGMAGIVLISVIVAVLVSRYVNKKKQKKEEKDEGSSMLKRRVSAARRLWRLTGLTRIRCPTLCFMMPDMISTSGVLR